eukprot:scaffold4795_cov126-Isochrysis_galbana.AAC.1
MPRLPSALGLGGAKRTGGLDWTLNPPRCALTPHCKANHRMFNMRTRMLRGRGLLNLLFNHADWRICVKPQPEGDMFSISRWHV